MCGIVTIFRYDGRPAKKQLIKRYNAQKNRGTKGYGFISFNEKNQLKEWFQAEQEAGIMECLAAEDASKIMFHHRFPTSTINCIEATHPIRVEHPSFKYAYFLVHNGVISNAARLKPGHEAKGFTYNTELRKAFYTKKNVYPMAESEFNDSESLAIEVALFAEGQQKYLGTTGSAAFVAVALDKVTHEIVKVFFGRNTSPLMLDVQKEYISLCSEGKGIPIEADQFHTLDLATRKITKEKVTIGTYIYHSQNHHNYYGDDDGYSGLHQSSWTPPAKKTEALPAKKEEPAQVTSRDTDPNVEVEDSELTTQYELYCELIEEEAIAADEYKAALAEQDYDEAASLVDKLTELRRQIVVMERVLATAPADDTLATYDPELKEIEIHEQLTK